MEEIGIMTNHAAFRSNSNLNPLQLNILTETTQNG